MKRYYALAVTLLLSANVALADKSPNWNYLEFGYLQGDIDDSGDIDPDGFGAGLSFEISDNFIFQLERLSISYDFFGTDIEATQTNIGFGYVMSATDTTDFVFGVSYVDVEACVDSFGCEDDNGYGLDVGLRSMLSDTFELGASIGYVDISDDSETSFGVSGNYYFTDNFSLGLAWDSTDDVDVYGLNARFSF